MHVHCLHKENCKFVQIAWKMKSPLLLMCSLATLTSSVADGATLSTALLQAAYIDTKSSEPVTCTPIPANMTLCTGLEYFEMRLPTLLGHETLDEAMQQAAAWLPLLKVGCDANAQLFLCSLFAPICLGQPIYPCQSLCRQVKSGCSSTMAVYGFPWPSMLDCSRFPPDNDMCIGLPSEMARVHPDDVYDALDYDDWDAEHQTIEPPPLTSLVDTEEDGYHDLSETTDPTEDERQPNGECLTDICPATSNHLTLVNMYCQSDFVMKVKFRLQHRTDPPRLRTKVLIVMKAWRVSNRTALNSRLRQPGLHWSGADCCLRQIVEHLSLDKSDYNRAKQKRKQRQKKAYTALLMGKRTPSDTSDDRLVVTFVRPWIKSKELRNFRRTVTGRNFDCLTHADDDGNLGLSEDQSEERRQRRCQQRARCQRRRRRRERRRRRRQEERQHESHPAA